MAALITISAADAMRSLSRLFNFGPKPAQRQTAVNVITNYGAMVWLNLLALLVIPIYVAHLGPSEWGLIATCLSVQVFFGVIDTALAQVQPRLIALDEGSPEKQFSTYRTFFELYLLLALLLVGLGQACAHYFAYDLVPIDQGDAQKLELCFRIVVLQLGCQLANSANNGFWSGGHQQGIANARIVIFGTSKHILALGSVLGLGLGVVGYAAAFALVSVVEVASNTLKIWKLEAHLSQQALPRLGLRQIGGTTGVMSVAAIIGAVVAQLDRIVLVHLSTPAQFGVYAVLLNVSASFLQIQAPIVRAFFPHIVAESRDGSFKWLLRLAIGTILVCTIPCLLAALLSEEILKLWLHNNYFVETGRGPLSLLLSATALSSIYNIYYTYFLSSGKANYILAINLLSLGSLSAASLLVSQDYGLYLGVGLVCMNSCIQFACGTFFMARERFGGRAANL